MDRDALLPLGTGLVVAVLINLLLVPAASLVLGTELNMRSGGSPAPETEPEPSKSTPFGQEQSVDRMTTSWVSHDDWRQLMASQSRVDQPTIQAEVDPVEPAPMITDPSLAGSETAAAPSSTPTQPADRVEQATAPAEPADDPQRPDEPVEATADARDLGLEVEVTEAAEGEAVAMGDARDPTQAAESEQPAPDPLEPETPTESAVAAPGDSAAASRQGASTDRPTSAPRVEDRSAAASTIVDAGRHRPGGVLVGQGIEIKTVAPRFGVISRLSSVPNSPVALVEFNRNGRAVKVDFIRSTGYSGYDAPIRASLYRWRAKGSQLEESKENIKVRIELLLR